MAHKKAAGSAKNLRDSKPKYRGVKVFGGQSIKAGDIVLRQKGSKYICGKNTYISKDFSIHAEIDGVVAFRKKNVEKFNGRKYLKTVVDVVPVGEEVKDAVPKAKKAPAKKPVAKKTTKPATKKKTPAKKSTTKKEVEAKKDAE